MVVFVICLGFVGNDLLEMSAADGKMESVFFNQYGNQYGTNVCKRTSL